jgi:hypothetical protein
LSAFNSRDQVERFEGLAPFVTRPSLDVLLRPHERAGVALEDSRGLATLRRTSWLVRGNWWRVASLMLFVTVIALLVGPLVGTLLLFVSSASFNFINLISSLVYVVVLPFAAIASTYMYFDLCVAKRLEEQTAEAGEDLLPAETPSTPVPASL